MPEVHSTFDPRRNPMRHRNMVQMEVDVRSARLLTLPDGQCVGRGKSIVTLYEDNVDAVKAQVETDLVGIEQATKAYELSIAGQVQERLGGQWAAMDPEEFSEKLKGGELEPKVQEHYEAVLKRTGSSVEAEFHRLKRRGIKPLVSASVVKDSVRAEPQREIQTQQQTELAETLAVAMVKAQMAMQAQANTKKS